MALATVLLATVISFSLASAAVFASVVTQQGTTRDHNSKEATAAADAGESIALLRLNRYANALTSSNPCLRESAGTLVTSAASADGWCPAIEGSVGRASYSYRVTPQVSNATLSVVSIGTAGSVSHRIDVSLQPSSVGSVLAAAGVIGEKEITIGGNGNIRSGIGTNGNVVGEGANEQVCGNIRHGTGHNSTAHQCNGYTVTEGNETLPPVSSFMPTNIATSNSDSRLVKCTSENVPTGCQSDTYSGKWGTTEPYNPATRAISLTGGTLTLGGGDYWLCSLNLSGQSHLIMANGAHIRLFFDTPEHCGISAGGTQVSFAGQSTIEATGYKAEPGHLEVPGLYLMGSTSINTKAILAGNSGTNEFIIYAPNTEVEISGNANYKGVIVGKTVKDHGNGEISQDAGFEPPKIGGATIYSRQSYVQCIGASASPPNANC